MGMDGKARGADNVPEMIFISPPVSRLTTTHTNLLRAGGSPDLALKLNVMHETSTIEEGGVYIYMSIPHICCVSVDDASFLPLIQSPSLSRLSRLSLHSFD